MPAVTLGQLQTALATTSASNQSTFFLEPGGSIASYLNEVGPRVYSMGMWRDLIVERTYLGADGYITLDRDVETVLHATINDMPRRVRSVFHEMRNLGNTTNLTDRWGLVDMGYWPVKRELASIQNVSSLDDVTGISTLHVYKPDGTVATNAALTGAVITVTGFTETGTPITGVQAAGTNATITFSTAVVEIENIQWSGIPFDVELLVTSTDLDTSVCGLTKGDGVARYRRFRVGGARDDTYVHILGKRGWTDVSAAADLVHLGNYSAWKHALLGKVAEDNADVERASYHWSVCRQLLDEELNAAMGGARPTPTYDFGGVGQQLFNIY